MTYRVYDGAEYSAPATVTIGVTNQAPIASDLGLLSVLHGGTISGIDLLGAASDPDNDSLSVEIVSYPTQGYLYQDWTTGKWNYSAPSGYAGPVTFAYRVYDGQAYSAPATVTIDVTNQAPIATDLGLFSVLHGGTISGIDLLGAASDADSDSLSVEIVSYPTQGYLYQDWNTGKWNYSAPSGYAGPVTFAYRVYDGQAYSNTASVTIDVTNQAPIATDVGPFSVLHGGTISGIDLLGAASDADNDSLSVEIVSYPTQGYLYQDWSTGKWNYSAPSGYAGPVTLAYRVYDGQAYSNPVNVTIDVTNQAPTTSTTQTFSWTVYSTQSNPNTVTLTNPGTQQNYDGASVSLSLVFSNQNANAVTFVALGLPAGLGIDENGLISGMVDETASAYGPYTVTVTARDGVTYATATQTFTWNIDANPLAVTNPADQQSVSGDTVSLTVSYTNSIGNPVNFETTGLPPGLAIASNGVISGPISSNAHLNGTYIAYVTVTDATANASFTVTFRWVVRAPQVAPTAADFGPVTVAQGGSLKLSVNQIAFFSSNPAGGEMTFSLVGPAQNGVAVDNQDGTVTYTPMGPLGTDSFTYKLTNAFGDSNTATVFLNVAAVSLVANDVFFLSQSGSAYVFTADDLIANVSTYDGSIPTLTAMLGASFSIGTVMNLPSGATITVQPDGSFVYQSVDGFLGTETISFTLGLNNVFAMANIQMVVAQNPQPPRIRLGVPIPLNTTLLSVLQAELPNWQGPNGISLAQVDALVQRRNLTVPQAAAVAVLKALIIQNPANLAQIGFYGNLFQVNPANRFITAAGIANYQAAFNNAANPNNAAARQLEATFQFMMNRLSTDVTANTLFPNGIAEQDIYQSVRQGNIGDCSFMSAVISYIRPTQAQGGGRVSPGFQDLRNRIVPAPNNAQGVATYNVTLFNGVGQGNAVVVNVEEPTYAERALYGGTTDGSRWLSILEKAYVTQWPRNNDPLLGIQIDTGPVYDVAANGERMDRALIRVTGRATQLIANQWVLPAAPILRGTLAGVNANANSALILAQSRTTGQLAMLPANMAHLRTMPQNHAFAVVRWTPRGLNDGVIRLRNPWNNGGAFGGEFDVTLQEFLRVFVNISRQTP
ncbi:MAG: tandem-95 repeat protein [Pirellulales bacterium]|nr:tandem-95 repeat protein [Pirellulales bacterium]